MQVASDGSLNYRYNWDRALGLRHWCAEAALIGDANLDDEVSCADFLTLLANFGNPKATTWAEGNFNCSGHDEFDDFLLLSDDFAKLPATHAVPEPRCPWLFLSL